MSDTCIVCLGDLSHAEPQLPAEFALDDLKSPVRDGVTVPPTDEHDISNTTTTTNAAKIEDELIAHLQPCGHDLHNECLTPWVERANSCPICRQSFHLVELTRTVGGKSCRKLCNFMGQQ